MKDLETIILPVLEMSCAVCANNVENTVKGLPGVEEASVNFAANTLSVKYHPSLITPQKMRVGTFHSAGPAGNGVYAYARR